MAPIEKAIAEATHADPIRITGIIIILGWLSEKFSPDDKELPSVLASAIEIIESGISCSELYEKFKTFKGPTLQ